MLEFLAVESQPHQPDPEGEQFIVTVGLAHDRAALGDSLGGDSKAQIHIGSNFSRVEMVTPKLTYAELPKLQECVRQVRHAGAKANSSCGLGSSA